MAKKISRRPKRSTKMTSAQRTIEEGREFVNAVLRRRAIPKRATRVFELSGRGSMVSVKPRRKAALKKSAPKVAKKPVRAVKKTTPIRKAVAVRSAGKVAKAARKEPAVVKKPSVSSSIVRRGSSSKPVVSNPSIGKATKLKTSSRSDLAIPAYGFIDVCFCVDATGSMCGELAQVQETI